MSQHRHLVLADVGRPRCRFVGFQRPPHAAGWMGPNTDINLPHTCQVKSTVLSVILSLSDTFLARLPKQGGVGVEGEDILLEAPRFR